MALLHCCFVQGSELILAPEIGRCAGVLVAAVISVHHQVPGVTIMHSMHVMQLSSDDIDRIPLRELALVAGMDRQLHSLTLTPASLPSRVHQRCCGSGCQQ